MTQTGTPLEALAHCVHSLHVHLVLVTKYRNRCLTPAIRDELHAILSDTASRWDCELLEYNGETDHVHCLLQLNPKVQPSKLVNNLKTISSRKLWDHHTDHLLRYHWTASSGHARTVSSAQAARHCRS